MKISVIKNSVWAVVITAILLITPALTGAADLTAEEIDKEAARYQAMGAVYKAEGFSEFPSQESPFYGHPGYGYYRLTQRRYRGKLLYEDKSGTDIGHSFSCGRLRTIYLELWLPGGPKGATPFAWQDPFLLCRNGGEPSGSDPFYVDITGDGKPEIRFETVGRISSLVHNNGVKVRIFTEAIIPAWIKKRLGASFVEGEGDITPGAAWIEPVYRPRNRAR